MFEEIHHSQNIADRLKGVILDLVTVDKLARIKALNSIQRLERCGWHRIAFQDAMQETGIGYEENEFVFGENVLDEIDRLIALYCENIGCGKEDLLNDIFDMQEAADYLGISREMLNTYVSRQKRLRGRKIGTSMVFTRRQLEDFRAEMRPPGNPNFKSHDEE